MGATGDPSHESNWTANELFAGEKNCRAAAAAEREARQPIINFSKTYRRFSLVDGNIEHWTGKLDERNRSMPWKYHIIQYCIEFFQLFSLSFILCDNCDFFNWLEGALKSLAMHRRSKIVIGPFGCVCYTLKLLCGEFGAVKRVKKRILWIFRSAAKKFAENLTIERNFKFFFSARPGTFTRHRSGKVCRWMNSLSLSLVRFFWYWFF